MKDRGIDANAIEHLFVQHDRYPVAKGREALEQTLKVRYLAVAQRIDVQREPRGSAPHDRRDVPGRAVKERAIEPAGERQPQAG